MFLRVKSGKQRFRCGEKLAPCVTVADVVALAWNHACCLQVTFFSSLLTLCFSMRPTLGNYFEVEPGSGIFF